ncbi:MAG: hypothetical protein AB8B71_15115 [Paracoccaceae bacterium]
MTDFTVNSSRSGNLILRLLTRFWDGLVYLGESSARARTLQVISEMSDEDLRARGLSRHDLVQSIVLQGRFC